MTWQPENVIGSKKLLLLLWPKVEFQYAAGKVKIHHFQHVISRYMQIENFQLNKFQDQH